MLQSYEKIAELRNMNFIIRLAVNYFYASGMEK